MFEQATLSNPSANRRVWTTGLGFAGEAALVAFIALAPIIWPGALPKPRALLMLLNPPAPVRPVRTAAVKPRTAQAPPARLHFDVTTIPKVIPNRVDAAVEDPPVVRYGEPDPGIPAGFAGSILTALPEALTRPVIMRTPAPPVEASPTEPKRIRTSSLELARVLHRVEPIYPSVAKLAHIYGTVELTAVVGTDGRVRELKALRGNPLLIQAAIDAVSQWIYAPPVLNGERVEVVAPITVNFRLDR